MSAVLRLVADEIELSKPASERLLSLLFQSLMVYVSRMTIAEPLPKWGRPIRDRRIEKALTLLNQDLSKRRTVDLLARAVGLSRPALAKLFVRVLCLTPMRYLTQRRMLAAAALLLESDAALAEVACRIGYASEFAFSRAFKRYYGISPGVYRQRSDAIAIAQTIECRMAA